MLQLLPNKRLLLLLVLGVALFGTPALASTPDWVRALASETIPPHDADTNFVVLLDEQTTTVNDKGEIYTNYRMAYKVLRPQGKEAVDATTVHYDKETKLTYLKGWSISPKGLEYEVKEKDALETGMSSVSLYDDVRRKILAVPGIEVGSIVAFEWEQKRRPWTLEDQWIFASPVPSRKVRYSFRLPAGWEYKLTWVNTAPLQPVNGGTLWEVTDQAGIEREPNMPPMRAVLPRLVAQFKPPMSDPRAMSNWNDFGKWFSSLIADRRYATPAIQERVKALTAGKTDAADRIRALSAFAQRDIRYVSIDLGINGYQPNGAGMVFDSRYGDCKDKVTLLSSMLKEIGIASYYILIHTDRGVVRADEPPGLRFNHAIIAVKLPEGAKVDGYASLDHKELGRLLIFDPTDEYTPVGQLPSSLQGSLGLLVKDAGAEIISMPAAPTEANKLQRTAKLKLSPDGTVSGEIVETRSGSYARDRRSALLASTSAERQKLIESFLGFSLGTITLESSGVEQLENYDGNLVLRYKFRATNYAKLTGPLLILRPRIVGAKADTVEPRDNKPRKQPIAFDAPGTHTDVFEFELPEGYVVDEMPDPTKIETEFATYWSKSEMDGRTLRYSREYKVRKVDVPLANLEQVRKVFRTINMDERSSAVLKKGQAVAATN